MRLPLTPFIAPLLLLLGACSNGDQKAQHIVDRSIEHHGGDAFDRSTIRFDFRGDAWEVRHTPDGSWHVIKVTQDSVGLARHILDPSGVRVERNGTRVDLTPEEERAIETTLNSVSYLAFLPYRLNDPAVRKRFVGVDTVRTIAYDMVEITFTEDGGGRDWQDRFLYWFSQDEGAMEYLAYEFDTGDGGTRFRAAINPRRVGPLLVQDFNNYTADEEGGRTPLEQYGRLYTQGLVERVSVVAIDQVEVLESD